MESFLGIQTKNTSNSPSDELDRIRNVRNTMDRLSYAYDKPEELSAYEEKMLEHLNETFKEFYEELDRLVNFLVLDGEYLSSKNTPERLVEVLKRLEKEVFGKVNLNYPRIAQVQVGQTLALSEYFEEYKVNKKETAIKLTVSLEEDMKRMLI
ncbi:MAG: hypothetical protein SFU25_00555 [Candidatus Caenarcaniphilales bacterium]|nr:hypothetical protein [Candidatus Caenarcaniphilales bacterium]